MIREWKLICQPRHIFAHKGPDFQEAEVWTIERDPVLNLLEQWVENDGLGAMDHEEATADLLRKHGRLQ